MPVTTTLQTEILYQEFLSSGIYYLPDGAMSVTVEVHGAGGGGKSGDFNNNTNSNTYPAYGGMGGQVQFITIPVSEYFPRQVPIIVGVGGSGGSAIPTVTGGNTFASGANGTSGTDSSFGSASTLPVFILAKGGFGAGVAYDSGQARNLSNPPDYLAYRYIEPWKYIPIFQINGATVQVGGSLNYANYIQNSGNYAGVIIGNSSSYYNNTTWTISYAGQNTITLSGASSLQAGTGGTIVLAPRKIDHVENYPVFTSFSDGDVWPGLASAMGGGGGGSGAYWGGASAATYNAAQKGGYSAGYPQSIPYFNYASAIGNYRQTGMGLTPGSDGGSGGSGVTPTAGTAGVRRCGGGGGGASGKTNSSNYNGANGGDGGFPGGGGGGGGAGYVSGVSGAGGRGANGRVRVWTAIGRR